jgi:hypothetical protein
MKNLHGQFLLFFAKEGLALTWVKVLRMCREILSSCVRNTEEAERLSKASEGSSVQSGCGLRKGVWVMIEESELAKSIRKGGEKRVRSNVYVYSFPDNTHPLSHDSSKVIYWSVHYDVLNNFNTSFTFNPLLNPHPKLDQILSAVPLGKAGF